MWSVVKQNMLLYQWSMNIFSCINIFEHLDNQQGEENDERRTWFYMIEINEYAHRMHFPLQIDSWFVLVLGSLNTHMNNKIAY